MKVRPCSLEVGVALMCLGMWQVCAQEVQIEWKHSVRYTKLMVFAEASRAIEKKGGNLYRRMFVKKDNAPDDWKDLKFKLSKDINDDGIRLKVQDIVALETPESRRARMAGYRCYVDIPFDKEKYGDSVVVSNQPPKSLTTLFVVIPEIEKRESEK